MSTEILLSKNRNNQFETALQNGETATPFRSSRRPKSLARAHIYDGNWGFVWNLPRNYCVNSYHDATQEMRGSARLVNDIT
jgi:hypothetical protein